MMSSADPQAKTLKLDQIRVDGGTQIRAEINDDAVAEYAEARKSGDILPPIIVFFDGSDYWLADGFHRFHSAKRNKAKSIRAEVRTGDRREAILCAVGSNTDHGLRRTNADKRNAIEALLRDEEWKQKSDRWVAETTHVDHKTVAKVRAELGNSPVEDTTHTRVRDEVRISEPENANGSTDNSDSGTRTGRDGKKRRSRPTAQAPPLAILAYKKIDEQLGKLIRTIDLLPEGERHDRLMEMAGELLEQLNSYQRTATDHNHGCGADDQYHGTDSEGDR